MTRIISVTPLTKRDTDLLVKFEVDGRISRLTLQGSGSGTELILDCTVDVVRQHLSNLRFGENLEFQLDFMDRVFPGAWFGVFGGWVQPLLDREDEKVIDFINGVYVMKIGEDTVEFLAGDFKEPHFASLNGKVVVGTDPRNTTDGNTPSNVFNEE